MSQELERYLNDHLAGSSGAVLLIQELIDTANDPDARDFFSQLKHDVEADRKTLECLLLSIGKESSAILKVAGNVAARVGFLKLAWEGFHPGALGMLEALEMLELGVQGKCLLWRALGAIAAQVPDWDGTDFSALEKDAARQRDGVEKRRMEAVLSTLVP